MPLGGHWLQLWITDSGKNVLFAASQCLPVSLMDAADGESWSDKEVDKTYRLGGSYAAFVDYAEL